MEEKYIDFAADEWYDHHRRKIVWFTAIIGRENNQLWNFNRGAPRPFWRLLR